MHALNKGLSHAVEGAVESHETGVEIGHQPVYTQQVSANAHAGAEILMHHQEVGNRKQPGLIDFISLLRTNTHSLFSLFCKCSQ